jgi:hypothetical protein
MLTIVVTSEQQYQAASVEFLQGNDAAHISNIEQF